MTDKQLKELLTGKFIKSELMPGVLPPVYSKFISVETHTVDFEDFESGCPFGISKSELKKELNKGIKQVVSNPY